MNILMLLFCGLIAFQNPVPPTGASAPPQSPGTQVPVQGQGPLPAAVPTQSSQLGAGDVVTVTVWTGSELLTQTLVIAADGTVLVPFYVNKIIKVSGLTSVEMRSLLDEELHKTYRNPVVQVIQNTVNSKRALLVTDVGIRSGFYPITGETKALDFVVANGGYAVGANLASVSVTHANGQRVQSNLFNVLMGTDTSGNIPILPDDLVFVPSLQTVSTKIFVVAEGRTVNVLQVQDRITILDALGRSGPAVTNSRLSDLAVIRYDRVKKQTVVYTVRFDEIYAKKANLSVNMLLENGDIIFLPKGRLYRSSEIIQAVSPIFNFIQQVVFFRTVL